MLRIFIRKIVRNNPELKRKLKLGDSKYTPFQYVFNTLFMTGFSFVTLLIIFYLIFKSNLKFLVFSLLFLFLSIPLIYKFWLSLIDVEINKLGRELDADLLFVSEFLLVELQSGLPLGNAIEKISKVHRPSGRFFKRVYLDFKTGKDFERTLNEAIEYCPSEKLKNLLKKLKDSLYIGVDIIPILKNFIKYSNEYNLIKIKEFSKSMNPLIMMYLLLGIVFPSLGVAIFILGASIMNITPDFLKYLLIGIFFLVFLFQYFSFTMFKYKKDIIKL